ncbi:MAG: hypothetical protein F7C35_06790 [Desulfurococcales archaeon]|nr:hypothetical protein [Desulfurococcales archaeon]
MVVSVDITGILEERLRRLVDLGIYASISEAVRDALRRLMDELDLKRISLQMYTSKEVSLHYTCHFAGSPCRTIIDYMLKNGVMPLLGETSSEQEEVAHTRFVLDPSAIFVSYNSLLVDVLSRLEREGFEFYTVPSLMKQVELLEAYAVYRRLTASLLNIRSLTRCVSTRSPHVSEVKKRLIISPHEEDTLEAALSCGIPIVSSDIRIRRVLKSIGIPVYSLLSIFREAIERGLVDESERVEIILSLRGVPIVLPPEWKHPSTG